MNNDQPKPAPHQHDELRMYTKDESVALLRQAMAAILSAASQDMDREACLAVCHGLAAGNVSLNLKASINQGLGLNAVCSVSRGGEEIELFRVEAAAAGCFSHIEVQLA
jgi:hypothetical protein